MCIFAAVSSEAPTVAGSSLGEMADAHVLAAVSSEAPTPAGSSLVKMADAHSLQKFSVKLQS